MSGDPTMTATEGALYYAVSNLALILAHHCKVSDQTLATEMLGLIELVPEPCRPVYRHIAKGIMQSRHPPQPGGKA